MIDTAPIVNRLTKRSTNRSTAGEGHVARHGDVRRVRKVIVGCPASRTLRGQTPVHNSSRYMRRTETVRNRLTQNPTTKPLSLKTAEAQTQDPSRKKTRNTTARAYTRAHNPSLKSFPLLRILVQNKAPKALPPLPQNTLQQRERARVRVTGADKREGAPQTTQQPTPKPIPQQLTPNPKNPNSDK